MLEIRKDMLNTAGIKFNLPDGFYIDTQNTNPDTLKFHSKNEDCLIEITTSEIIYESPLSSIMDIFTDFSSQLPEGIDMFSDNETGYVWIDKPQNLVINNISAAYCKYLSCSKICLEIHFERLWGQQKQLEVLITADNSKTLSEQKSITDFLNSFSKI